MFTTTDPLNRKINCSSETWSEHIINGHVIMESNLNSVKNTVENPEVIFQSNQTPIRDVYFSRTESSYSPLFTKVVVEFNESSGTGEIVSAWPQKDISGGIDSEVIKYVKIKL